MYTYTHIHHRPSKTARQKTSRHILFSYDLSLKSIRLDHWDWGCPPSHHDCDLGCTWGFWYEAERLKLYIPYKRELRTPCKPCHHKHQPSQALCFGSHGATRRQDKLCTALGCRPVVPCSPRKDREVMLCFTRSAVGKRGFLVWQMGNCWDLLGFDVVCGGNDLWSWYNRKVYGPVSTLKSISMDGDLQWLWSQVNLTQPFATTAAEKMPADRLGRGKPRGGNSVFFVPVGSPKWWLSRPSYPLVNLWNITIFNGTSHYTWLFSIAMLNYQVVYMSDDAWYLSKEHTFQIGIQTIYGDLVFDKSDSNDWSYCDTLWNSVWLYIIYAQ